MSYPGQPKTIDAAKEAVHGVVVTREIPEMSSKPQFELKAES